MLQETHSLTEDETTWRNEIDCPEVFYSHGTNDSKDTLIALGRSLDYTLQNDRNHLICDPDGRFIILHIEIQGSPFVIVNFYAANDEAGQVEVLKKTCYSN